MKILATEREGRWVAHAMREDTGDLFGIECGGATEREAVERLTRWLQWQRDHAAALGALQQAQRAYHRMIAGSAFTNGTEGSATAELQRDALASIDAVRVRLDEVRVRKPD